MRLEAALPGVKAGPDSPPFCRAAKFANDKSPLASSSLWQPPQYFVSTGAIWLSKSGAASLAGTLLGMSAMASSRRPAILVDFFIVLFWLAVKRLLLACG